MWTPVSPWGMSSRHSACGSYLDVFTSPNQSLHSFAPSPAPGLIGQCSEVNVARALQPVWGSVSYEPLGSWLTGFLWLSLGLSSAVLFLLGGLRVITSRLEWIKEFPFQSLLFHWCCAGASLTGIKRLPKTFCVSTAPQFILSRWNTCRKWSKLLRALLGQPRWYSNRNPLQSRPGKQGSISSLMVHGCMNHYTPELPHHFISPFVLFFLRPKVSSPEVSAVHHQICPTTVSAWRRSYKCAQHGCRACERA